MATRLPNITKSTYSPRKGTGVLRRDQALVQLYLHGHELSKDLLPLQRMAIHHFPRKIGVPVTLGAAELFRRAVTNEQKPPHYDLIGKGLRSRARGYPRTFTYGFERGHYRPRARTGGFAWYSGTLRKAWRSRVVKVGKRVIWSGMSPDANKGRPPRWQRWGKPVNAYHYARWIEFGDAPGMPERPIVRTAFRKNRQFVARWMQQETAKYFLKFAYASRPQRIRRAARGTSGMRLR